MGRQPRYFLAPEHGSRERWLVSYTDIMTILLILFVAVAAKGVQRTQPKPASRPAAANPLESARVALVRGGLHPRMEARGLVISLPQTILFPSGEDTIVPSA